ncbi:hypothetical protein L6164_018376 [Bauhinia variegata]|uniref:Uncharacterized protein n=1 Tax=Bauhinia variegata TaxID=167791 RepID=A0ACB9NBR3_BAUVA|nr:hypothetical protein L6164_018376 [Bauhinia variegata]
MINGGVCGLLSRAKKKEKVIVVSGPTGSGKSRFALELAKRLNGEIISADSVEEGMGFCLSLNGSLMRVFIQTKIQLVIDKQWNIYQDVDNMGVGAQVENFTAFYQNFKRHLEHFVNGDDCSSSLPITYYCCCLCRKESRNFNSDR